MNSVLLPRLRIVVLAAGFSSRLGRPKALARVHGTTLLRRTLRLAASLTAGPVIAVVPRGAARYRSEARGLAVTFKMNARRAQGLSSSVRRAILSARYASAVLLLPMDLVNLERRELSRLVSRARSRPRGVTARRVDRGGAAPLILPRWLFARTAQLAGDVGLRDLLRQLPIDSLTLVDMPSASNDLDTPQDLDASRRNFRRAARLWA